MLTAERSAHRCRGAACCPDHEDRPVVSGLSQSGAARNLFRQRFPSARNSLMNYSLNRSINSAIRHISPRFLLLLDDRKPSAFIGRQTEEHTISVDFSRIRCPVCKWQPKPAHRWFCASCSYPEYFDAGCGTCWNTFITRGRCPGCHHQWRWTACLNCAGWSLHADWYKQGVDKMP